MRPPGDSAWRTSHSDGTRGSASRPDQLTGSSASNSTFGVRRNMARMMSVSRRPRLRPSAHIQGISRASRKMTIVTLANGALPSRITISTAVEPSQRTVVRSTERRQAALHPAHELASGADVPDRAGGKPGNDRDSGDGDEFGHGGGG